jgi:hypothetical protein
MEIDYWDLPTVPPLQNACNGGTDFSWAIEFNEPILKVFKIVATERSHLF